VPVIFAHKGTVDKFMATRSWPFSEVRERTRCSTKHAVRAAIENANRGDQSESHSGGFAASPLGDFGIGVAIAGEVVHGICRQPTDRMEFTVIGDAG